MQKDRAITYRAQVKQQHACSLQVDVEKGHRQALNQADKYLAIPHWAKWAQFKGCKISGTFAIIGTNNSFDINENNADAIKYSCSQKETVQ